MEIDSRPVPARALLHQEGVLGLVAVIGLSFRPGGAFAQLGPRGGWVESLLCGLAVGMAAALVLWLGRHLPAIRGLELWQRGLVVGWSPVDAVAVAVLSGLAEEALVRALLQPMIGLGPAAAVFALLHLVPDRRLWFWPLLAFGMGIVLGWLYESYGYPAAVIAHVALNSISLLRLRHAGVDSPGATS